jgi:hypothetical protein
MQAESETYHQKNTTYLLTPGDSVNPAITCQEYSCLVIFGGRPKAKALDGIAIERLLCFVRKYRTSADVWCKWLTCFAQNARGKSHRAPTRSVEQVSTWLRSVQGGRPASEQPRIATPTNGG